jgi:integrase
MGPQHVRDGVLSIRQQKTGTELVIPVHGNLLASLDTARTGEMVFLLTSQGRAFTANGFGNFFRDAVESAGLRGLSAHGLRKAACRRLAEAGCSAHEIMSISGHVSLREVQRYTMAANREQMARSAFQKLGTSQNKNSQT